MKNGLMVVSPNQFGLMNIGDFIQAQAAKQYFDNIDVLLDRDYDLAQYNEEDIKMIMNGWYMDHPENFPPSNKIKPLLISMHINKYALPTIIREECINYFKSHEPIGCRDYYTVDLLKKYGIKAYFSGCLTLTLGRKYKYTGMRKGIYMVEPYFSTQNFSKRPRLILKAVKTLLLNFRSIKHISQKKGDISLKSLLHNSIFYHEYIKIFEKKILLDAEYISQYNTDIAAMTYSERLDYAEELINKYARAELVITSRIHCGLPCLGLETPVIYTINAQSEKMSSDRFGGLIELFNVITWHKDSLIGNDKITLINKPQNKDLWRPIAKKLIEICEDFTQ